MSDLELEWIKSVVSGSQGGNCVEVAFANDEVLVRDSKNPAGPVLRFNSAEWAAFVAGARDGEFDAPGC